MSRVFEALQKLNSEGTGGIDISAPQALHGPDVLQTVSAETPSLESCPRFHVSNSPISRLVAFTDQESAGAESIRVLSTRLRHIRRKRPLSKVLVTSCMQGEGKTVLASNLAVSLAKHNQVQTLLIDGDLRRPSLTRTLGAEGDGGIAEWWKSDKPPEQFLRRAEDMALWFLPAGQVVDQPLEILQSPRFADLMTRLGSHFEWVIVDSPPFIPMADSTVWASLTDGTVFVVRENHTVAGVFRKVLEGFDHSKLIGAVVNESMASVHHGYDKYYYR